MAVYGPLPVPEKVVIVSLVTVISCPSPMPTACVAPKPVPATVTDPPVVCVVGVRVIDPAAAVTEAKAKDSIKIAIIHAMTCFVLYFIFFLLDSYGKLISLDFLNKPHSRIVSAKRAKFAKLPLDFF